VLYIATTEKSLEQVCDDLQKAIASRSFGVVAVHDLQKTMVSKGVPFDHSCRLYEVCNPHQAKRVLESKMEISTALPCRISVYEDGGQIKLATIRPTAMLQMFGDAELQIVAQEVEQVMVDSMDEAAG